MNGKVDEARMVWEIGLASSNRIGALVERRMGEGVVDPEHPALKLALEYGEGVANPPSILRNDCRSCEASRRAGSCRLCVIAAGVLMKAFISCSTPGLLRLEHIMIRGANRTLPAP